MSLLFEHYVLGLLWEAYGNEIHYQEGTHGNIPDFWIERKDKKYEEDEETGIFLDAKYKRIYQTENGVNHQDMRQLSGYARHIKLLENMGFAGVNHDFDKIVPCVILYPAPLEESINQNADYDVFKNDKNILANPKKQEIHKYVKFYKIPISLPVLEK